MDERIKMPWSFYAVIVTFGVFFFSLNMYIFTGILQHPFASPWWLVGVGVGSMGLLFSVHKVRVHQRDLIAQKKIIDQGCDSDSPS